MLLKATRRMEYDGITHAEGETFEAPEPHAGLLVRYGSAVYVLNNVSVIDPHQATYDTRQMVPEEPIKRRPGRPRKNRDVA